MPKSKRAKVVHMSKVEKKGKELSTKTFAAVQEAADQYQYCFVFSVDNMRNTYLKDLRQEFADNSRIFFGKTKVMAKALGLTPEEEHLPNIHELARHLSGNVGLLFSNQQPADILSYFEDYVQTDFARAGVIATRDFTVPDGVVYSTGGETALEEDVPLPHSLEPTLRKWGMPTRLNKGKVTLDAPYEVCKEGKAMNSNQTALLKMFGIAMADFKIQILAYYSAAEQQVTEVE
ncbi:hypothetical protein FH972_024549 [Carpinus fangiana]|uniref:Ribosome assembly factor mrt4 n=1 Tax=Carpinus fangiana TaxID=176857 RepID=A0A5N6KYB3_9ROSI|nr:hypothetical protein FH972_024549 [Carpinus fangiana]